ncbi:glycosyltransferase [Amycolatopsis vancoresmycina]|uniref:Family 2 glycosyl transferase n=1 Tax=Amycolatopsis vancoresmycina DSM 44592 TaxID=1292037 RepID=R1H9U3_9PSEU|nr:glycosyltransferase [Amycolatopsis vancoresmycina]EOD57221.1 family 2 glycosyl transferase [Amycolatopsis vancoresmycina DSM 44592]
MIEAVGVVVPARDEAELVGACVHALRDALRQLPSGVSAAVCVVADRCRDTTAAVARAAFGDLAGVVVECRSARTIGEVRDFGLARVRRLLDAPAAGTLLLSTDADTRVTPGWARAHLARARQGYHAIAGTAELSTPFSTSARALRRYEDILGRARTPAGHGSVYGANLGIRADAFDAVGGFGPCATGEDHDLWRRLGRAGFRRCFEALAPVVTSARLHGRAPDGLAALLRSLVPEPDCCGGRP